MTLFVKRSLWAAAAVAAAALIAARPPPEPAWAQGTWSAELTVAAGGSAEWTPSSSNTLSPSGFLHETQRYTISEIAVSAGALQLTLTGPSRWDEGEFYLTEPTGGREWVYRFDTDSGAGFTHRWNSPPSPTELAAAGTWRVGIRDSSPLPAAAAALPDMEGHRCLHLINGWPVIPDGAPAECSGLNTGLYPPPTGPWSVWLGDQPGGRASLLPGSPAVASVGAAVQRTDAGGAFTEWGGWEAGYGETLAGGVPEQAITVVPHRTCLDMDATAADGTADPDCYGMAPDLVCYPARTAETGGGQTRYRMNTLDMRTTEQGTNKCEWDGWGHSRAYRMEAVMVFRVFVHDPLFCENPADDPQGRRMCGPAGARVPYLGSDPSNPHALRNQAISAAFTDIKLGDIAGGMLYAGEVPQFFACPVQVAAARIER